MTSALPKGLRFEVYVCTAKPGSIFRLLVNENKHGRSELLPAYLNGQMGTVKTETAVCRKMAKPRSQGLYYLEYKF